MSFDNSRSFKVIAFTQVESRLPIYDFLLAINCDISAISHQFQQEAPLTLRGQRGRCRNIKGEPQIFGSFPSPRPRPLFLVVVFMVSLVEPQLHAKFEVASFSTLPNYLRGTTKFWELLYKRVTSTFSSVLDFMMGFGKSQQHANFVVAIFSRCRNNIVNHQNFGKLP